MTRFKVDHDALYITDNGCVLCGEHLGSSAYHTGRDVSGQRIIKVTPAHVREAESLGLKLKCEGSCQRTASPIHSIG